MTAQKDHETEWKRIQTKTFTRWCNEHLKVQGVEIEDLGTAFCDGVNLIVLLEVLSGKSVGRFNRKPKRLVQSMENVSLALDFITKTEKIKLVNIGTADIVKPNIKLILGLVWTLILHYQISIGFESEEPVENTPRRDGNTVKQKLLEYIQKKLTNRTVKNLTTDWNDGILIGALVDAHAPGLCTEVDTMDPQNALENATLAMKRAEKWLEIAQLLEPQDMVNPRIDELSMMTYLSQFLEAKLKPGAPLKERVDPSKVAVYGPGVEGMVQDDTRPEIATFTVDTRASGSGIIAVHCTGAKGPVIVNIEDNQNQTYTCNYILAGPGIYTIDVRLNGKPVKNSPFKVNVSKPKPSLTSLASKVKVTGPGLKGGRVWEPLNLIIDTREAGTGSINATINGPDATTTTDNLDDGTTGLTIVASEVGKYVVEIEYEGVKVQSSPFHIIVCDPSHVRVYGSGVKEEGVKVGEQVEVLVDLSDAGEGPLEVHVTSPKGRAGTVEMSPTEQPNVLRGVYVPEVPGIYNVEVQLAEMTVLTSHVTVASRSRVDGSKVAFADCDNVIDVYTSDGDMGVEFQFKGHQGLRQVDCTFERKSADRKVVHYTPHHVGTLLATVVCAGNRLEHEVRCVDPTKVGISESIHSAVSGIKQTFVVDTSLAGPGSMDVAIMGPEGSPLHVDVVESPETPGVYAVTYMPPAVKPPLSVPSVCIVDISFEGRAIVGSPFEVQISNPTEVEAYGPGLENAIATEVVSFTVDASQAGDGSLNLAIEGPEECSIDCQDNGDHTYCVSYVPPLVGTYSVNIRFAEVHIPGSPFLVTCSRAPPSPSKCHAHLDWKNQTIAVDARGAGGTGALEVGVWGAQVPARFVSVEHNGDYTFSVSYDIPEPGEAEISIKWHGQHISGSPFKVVTE